MQLNITDFQKKEEEMVAMDWSIKNQSKHLMVKK